MDRRLLSGFVALAACALAQPAFEVASVKPADPNANGTSIYGSPGQLHMENFSLQDLIKQAFQVKDFSISGPSWLTSARFDVVAKRPSGSSRQQVGAMLQSLLADRFHMTWHRQTRVMPAYALLVDKKGLKLQPVEGEPEESGDSGPARLTAYHTTMSLFADSLSTQLDRPVKDMTGLPGIYDIKLRWIPEGADPATLNLSLPTSIFTALQEIAGLKLEPRRLPIEILVVDHIERQPTGN